MDKYISKQQMKVILEQAPKGTTPGGIVQSFADKGYKIEGFNDTVPVQKQSRIQETIGDIKQVGTDVAESSLKRGENINTIKESFKSGEQSGLRSQGQIIGQLAGAGADAIGAFFKGAGNIALSDKHEKDVSDIIGKFGAKVMAVPEVQNIINKYNALPEDKQRDIDAVGGVVNLVSNFIGGKAAQKTVETTVDAATNIAKEAKTKIAGALEETAQQNVIKQSQNKLQKTIEMTSDVLNKEDRIKAIKEGRGVSPTTFEKGALQASEKDIKRANLVNDVINSKDLNTNISNATSEIKHIAENKLRPFLQENPNYYDPQDLVDYMTRKMQPSMSIKNDPKAFKIFKQIKEKALSLAQKNPADTEGILDARQTLDRFIKDEFGDTVFQEAQGTAIKKAPVQARNAFNDFIADSLKTKGNVGTVNKIEELLGAAQDRGIKLDNIDEARSILQEQYGLEILPENELKEAFFRYNMKKQSALYEAIDNMATRAEQAMGDSKAEAKIKAFKKNNPIKTRAARSAVQATVVGGLVP